MQEYNVRVYNNRTEWRQNGELHRMDGPAIEGANGYKEWWVNGKLHRTDGPAVEYSSGTKEWWVNGKLHRTDGPAIESSDGSKEWWVNGKLHREDGPAVEWVDGSKEWYHNGKLQRIDGPAIEYSDRGKEWYIDGVEYTEDEFNKKINSVKEMTFHQILAQKILQATELREQSFDHNHAAHLNASQTYPNFNECYNLSLRTACNLTDPIMEDLLVSLLLNSWNDAIEWAETIV